jgi:hypothetical protein
MERRELTLGLLAVGIAIATHAGAQTAASNVPRVTMIASGDEAFFQPFRDRFAGMRAHKRVERQTFDWTFGMPAKFARRSR